MLNDFLLVVVLHAGCVTLFCHAIRESRTLEPRWLFLLYLREAMSAVSPYIGCSALWAVHALHVVDLLGLRSL